MTDKIAIPSNDEFDISLQGVQLTTIVELLRPDGEPLVNNAGVQCTVTVYGPGSEQYQKAQGKRNRTVVEAVRKGAKKMKDADQRDADAEFLATCTASFNGFGYKGITDPQQKHKQAYLDPAIGYIAEQVNKSLNDWAAFMKPSATT